MEVPARSRLSHPHACRRCLGRCLLPPASACWTSPGWAPSPPAPSHASSSAGASAVGWAGRVFSSMVSLLAGSIPGSPRKHSAGDFPQAVLEPPWPWCCLAPPDAQLPGPGLLWVFNVTISAEPLEHWELGTCAASPARLCSPATCRLRGTSQAELAEVSVCRAAAPAHPP